jgi:TrmH family RNA methyltransferase
MITSVRNAKVLDAAKLKKRGLREERGLFLVEGAQGVGEALRASVVETVFHVPGSTGRVPEVVEAARATGVPTDEVSEQVMAHLTSAVTPQGVVAVARFVDVPLARVPPEGVVPFLCAVRDPGNAGTILRSADAAGAAGVVFTTGSVDVYNAKAVRASAGSLFHLPVVREVDAADAVAAFRTGGVQVLAAAADGDVSVYDTDLTGPTVLLLGNEAWGLPSDVRDLADRSVRIPIAGAAESLNLAAAATLLLFEAARQRAIRPALARPIVRGASAGAGGDGDLASVISASVHDLRLPLTALKGFASTLVDRWDRFPEASRKEMIEGMLLDIERVSAMIALMVDAAKISQGRVGRTPERRDVAEALEWLAELYARSRDYPEVQASGNAEAAIDRERLQSLLLALSDGAMWWGQEGPIVVEARPNEGGAVIEVRRGGPGPTAEDLEGMFGGPGTEGSKIGLHIARRVAEAVGGSLVAAGGEGVTFRLELPG